MSNEKYWDRKDSERKTSKSIYLTEGDWEYLYKEGKGSLVKIIREMIIDRRNREDIKNNLPL